MQSNERAAVDAAAVVADATAGEGDGVDMRTVPGALKAPVGFFRRNRNNFFLMATMLVVGFLLNAFAGDLYARYVSPWKDSDDDFIGQLAAEQKQQFAALNASLADIRGSLPSEGRDAFNALQRSLANVERDSAGLVQQLDLAQREIQQLRTVAVGRGGLGSGYDFTLATDTSMDLAPGAVLGLTRVLNGGVRVNLTSGGTQTANSRFLESGETLAYRGANGRECWVSLLSIRGGNPGAASFKAGCPS